MAKKLEFDMELVKKYIFWVCVPIGLVIVVLAGWTMSGSVAKDFEARKKQLETEMTNSKKILNETQGKPPKHPNNDTVKDIAKVRTAEEGSTFSAWKILEKKQKEENKWAVSFQNINIDNMDFLEELNQVDRQTYQNHATNYLKTFLQEANIERSREWTFTPEGEEVPVDGEELDVINFNAVGSEPTTIRSRPASNSGRSGSMAPSVIRPNPVPGGGPGRGRTEGEPKVTKKGKVIWGSPQLELTLQNWAAGTPASYEIWLTQEDLWVYQALLGVVRESNAAAKATSPKDAAVKEIVSIKIGKSAAVKLKEQTDRVFGGQTAAGASGKPATGASPPRGGAAPGKGGTAPAESKITIALTERYVDDKGQPLASTDLPKTLREAPYRRMPIYLEFVVDQNRIPDLLVECANCPMPIDVLWVKRRNARETPPFEYGTGIAFAGRGGDRANLPPVRNYGRDRNPSESATGFGGQSGDPELGNDAVTVEIYGCINIFSRPDQNKIGKKIEKAGK